MSTESQMSASIRNISSNIRLAYDNAVMLGRTQRLLFTLETGEAQLEQAPVDFQGRPQSPGNSSDSLFVANKQVLLQYLDEKYKNQSKRLSPYSEPDNPLEYSIRSLPVLKRETLRDKPWRPAAEDSFLKKPLAGQVVFAKFISGADGRSYDYVAGSSQTPDADKTTATVYFFPDGTATAVSLQLAFKNQAGTIADNDAKYTLNLNTLTGQLAVLEGFQDGNFKLKPAQKP